MARIIAFIPVRGGSKSIPLKNIKLLHGKPLVYWSIEALQKINKIDQIVVATDSKIIEDTVNSFGFNKVTIYHRLLENASDTASTESVMLEYIEIEKIDSSTIFMLVQATSPMTLSSHFEEGLNFFLENKYDSVLSCVRFKRFFWNPDGTSKNYNYQCRPRRQDFSGELMENGAFYISTVENIITSKNRLSGRIGLYEMPSYTAFEIDEPEDWIIIENLMSKYSHLDTKTQSIKLFISDVDGVLTDGGMYYSEDGNELKKFNTRDGMGFHLLKCAGIKTGIITSELTDIVSRRARKLNVDYVFQNKRNLNKLSAALEMCEKENITLDEVAYIGDDINCLELLSSVGLAACPNDAAQEVINIPKIKHLSKKGGEGVVREFIDIILDAKQ